MRDAGRRRTPGRWAGRGFGGGVDSEEGLDPDHRAWDTGGGGPRHLPWTAAMTGSRAAWRDDTAACHRRISLTAGRRRIGGGREWNRFERIGPFQTPSTSHLPNHHTIRPLQCGYPSPWSKHPPPHEQAPRGVLRALTCHILPKWYKNKKGYLRKGGDGWNDGLR